MGGRVGTDTQTPLQLQPLTAQGLGGPGLTQGITLKVVTLEVGNSFETCHDSLKAQRVFPNEV